jgi:hypothetical protein
MELTYHEHYCSPQRKNQPFDVPQSQAEGSGLILGGALISTLRRGVWRSRSINIQWSRAREGSKWSCLFMFDRVYCYRNTVFPAIKYGLHSI